MAHVASLNDPSCHDGTSQEGDGPHDEASFVALIIARSYERGLSLRDLERVTGINRARLGRVLHRDISKRHRLGLTEFRRLLTALEIDPVEALLAGHLADRSGAVSDARFARVGGMVSCLVSGLPERLIAALAEQHEMDGSEIRQEWGTYFQRAVVSRTVHEVGQILERRARLATSNDPLAL